MTIGEIFRENGAEYRRKKKVPYYKVKTMKAIEKCKTSAMGGHTFECDDCGHVQNVYNSCKNRHCPNCQAGKKEEWLEKRKKDLLPVGYFHVVMTVPHELNDIFLVNQQIMYNILFKSVSETLITLGKDPKHLGGEIGFISILHTWGQNLLDHNHIHCIIPGVGLAGDGTWIKSRDKYLIPVQVISDLYKKKFMEYFDKAWKKGNLKFVGKIEHLSDYSEFKQLKNELYKTHWNVYSKPPFGGPEQVLSYIGRYTHRVAISNSRILNNEEGEVKFRWKDYRDEKTKVMQLKVDEFIRRFLLHILPDRFVKIRYFGILSNRNKEKFELCKKLLSDQVCEEDSGKSEEIAEAENFDVRYRCPVCLKGIMKVADIIFPCRGDP